MTRQGLTGLFWFLGKYSRSEMGMVFGSRESYGWAVVYPLVVPGVLTVAAFALFAWFLCRRAIPGRA